MDDLLTPEQFLSHLAKTPYRVEAWAVGDNHRHPPLVRFWWQHAMLLWDPEPQAFTTLNDQSIDCFCESIRGYIDVLEAKWTPICRTLTGLSA